MADIDRGAASKESFKQGQKKQSKNSTNGHIFRKRQPQKPELGDNIIYVSTKSNVKALLEKCTKLINDNENEIVIYCLGAAIQRGILLALQIKERHITFEISTNTLTTELTDDLEPAVDDADYEIQRRYNPSLRIQVFRKDPLELSDKKD